ncbi:phosphoenolpyruvate mutase [Rhizobium rhizogenes]|uniref:phosphoenolpyruvate mutase n=1 Tax=Rhizobium rhizogenes (strain K84 / ATCC BAA-868) TaxID=311403 RepID=B9JNZ3_RHIR8|nr:phosphoenolpyruvate phosphomutase protein [Rhizobium rhizogenes K84]
MELKSITPDVRRGALRALLEKRTFLRFLDIHNALSALIVEHTIVETENGSQSFDGMWASSLTDATARGMPDIEVVDVASRLGSLGEVMQVTSKPVIYDADTGGKAEHFAYTVRKLEWLGVSAAIVEDKTGVKRNSLYGTDVVQSQDTPDNFARKIAIAKKAQISQDFMLIARIESFILGKGLDDALMRAEAYLAAGADGIMIHSREKLPDEVFSFCRKYNRFVDRKPLIVVPSSFNMTTEQALADEGVNICIYANQLIRSAYPSMVETARSILTHSRSAERDNHMMPIQEILDLIPTTPFAETI